MHLNRVNRQYNLCIKKRLHSQQGYSICLLNLFDNKKFNKSSNIHTTKPTLKMSHANIALYILTVPTDSKFMNAKYAPLLSSVLCLRRPHADLLHNSKFQLN